MVGLDIFRMPVKYVLKKANEPLCEIKKNKK